MIDEKERRLKELSKVPICDLSDSDYDELYQLLVEKEVEERAG